MEDYAKLLRHVRHPQRIRSSQLIAAMTDDFEPIQSPDPALVAGTGRIGDTPVLVLGQQKPPSSSTPEALAVNFGMMRATGYWFVVEQLERAAARGLSVVTLIDTPGADPSKSGVKQLVAWAVSASIASFVTFPEPIVSVIIGEGGSGGALALQVANRRLMVSDAIYSVISPESCSAILFRDNRHVQQAMEVLQPSAGDMLAAGLIDEIVDWSDKVGILDHGTAANRLTAAVQNALDAAREIPPPQRTPQRMNACMRTGQLLDPFPPDTNPPLTKSASPPPLRRFVTTDDDDHAFGLLREAYFAEQGELDWSATANNLRCPSDRGGCGAVFPPERYEQAGWACPACGRGERLNAEQWITLLCDPGTFVELYPDLDVQHLDRFPFDSETYRRQRKTARQRTGASEAMRVGRGRILGTPCALAISDFTFMGGTLGATTGEKFRLICRVAREDRMPLVSLVCSGGVRMQDGTLGLAQMAKTNASALRVMETGLPHISIMADPCTGGAMASYGTCATAILAEPRALLAFAGPRVMELAGLPVNLAELTSESYAQHGGIDEVVPRHQLRTRIRRYFDSTTDADLLATGQSAAVRRNRAITKRRVSAWFGNFVNQLAGIMDGAQGFLDALGSNEAIRANLVNQLADFARVGIPTLLIKASQSPQARVRANALAALAQMPGTGLSPLRAALDDTHHRARANAAFGVLRMAPNDPNAQRTVVELLGSSQPPVRRHGLYVVCGVPLAAFHEPVRALSNDPDPTVRLAAGVALAAYGEMDRAVATIKGATAVRTTQDSWRVEKMLTMLPTNVAAELRQQLGLE